MKNSKYLIEKGREAVKALKELYPSSVCALEYEGEAWKLLVMGRLSAQCTDARVNIVCRELFAACPTAEVLADAPVEEIERIVHPCGLFRTKAKNIKDACRLLCDDYGRSEGTITAALCRAVWRSF